MPLQMTIAGDSRRLYPGPGDAWERLGALPPWHDRAQNNLGERLGEEAIRKVKGGEVRNGRPDWEEEETKTSHTGRSSWRVKRRSQEQNAVEQVTLGDSEPVSTSSLLRRSTFASKLAQTCIANPTLRYCPLGMTGKKKTIKVTIKKASVHKSELPCMFN